jgi:hypothetical protein
MLNICSVLSKYILIYIYRHIIKYIFSYIYSIYIYRYICKFPVMMYELDILIYTCMKLQHIIYVIPLPEVPARGGTEVASGIYYKNFLIYRNCMRRPGPCVRALCEAVAVLSSKNMTCARLRCNATPSEDYLHSSHCTLLTTRTSHFTLCTSHSTLHLISKHVSSSHLISAFLISSHLFSHVI